MTREYLNTLLLILLVAISMAILLNNLLCQNTLLLILLVAISLANLLNNLLCH